MHPDDTTRVGRDEAGVAPLLRCPKYRITGKVGEGGMGVVYKAVDAELGRTVALKFLPPHATAGEEAEERFLREARAASSLDHVHIGAIHAIEEDAEGRRFIVMAYYEGESLAARLERASGPLAPAEALKIAMQVAEGLRAAHERGVTHRDIKPSNILITKQGVVKIVDFGLAQVQGATPLTREGTQMGTPAYMSPEQALGGDIDHRTDVWSLGAVLHEMLTGERPFQAPSVPATLYQVVHEPPRALERAAPAIRPLLKRALAKDPAARFSSAAELLDALRAAESNAAADSLPETARPRGGSRAQAWPRRKLAAVALAMAVLAGGTLAWRNRSPSARPDGAGMLLPGSASGGYLEAAQRIRRWDKPGNLDEAARLLEQSVQADPSFALGHARLAEVWRIRYALKRDKAALEMAAKHSAEALRLDPGLAPVQVVNGRVHALMGNNDLAMAAFERALKLDPNDGEAHQAIGRQYERMGRFGDAENAYRRALELDPDDLAARDAYGNFLFRQSRHEDAIRQWQEVIQRAPDHAAALVNLGSALSETGRVSDAISIYQQLVKVKPEAMAWTNLGTAYSRAKRYPDAVAAYRKALELQDRDSMTWGNLAFVYSWMPGHEQEAGRSFAKAIELAEQQRKLSPRDAFLHSDLALYYAKTGREKLARDRLATALLLSPKGPEIHAAAAETHELLGDRGKAMEYAGEALRLGYSRQRLERNPELAGLLAEARVRHSF
jgi:serine/threonine-protein kinase